MKYETIDAAQIDDLMARRPVREPAGWSADDNSDTPSKPTATAEAKTDVPPSTDEVDAGDKSVDPDGKSEA